MQNQPSLDGVKDTNSTRSEVLRHSMASTLPFGTYVSLGKPLNYFDFIFTTCKLEANIISYL